MKNKLLLCLVLVMSILGYFIYIRITEPSYEEIMNSFLPEIEEAMSIYKEEYFSKKELFMQLETADSDIEIGNISIRRNEIQDGYTQEYYSNSHRISAEEFMESFPETYVVGQTLNDKLSLFSGIGKYGETLYFSCPTIFKDYGWGIQITISKNDDYIYDFSETLDDGWQISYKIYPPA